MKGSVTVALIQDYATGQHALFVHPDKDPETIARGNHCLPEVELAAQTEMGGGSGSCDPSQ